MARKSYIEECEAHARAMEQFRVDMQRVRDITRIEARYSTTAPQFSRIMAEVLLDWYLGNAERITHDEQIKVKKCAA